MWTCPDCGRWFFRRQPYFQHQLAHIKAHHDLLMADIFADFRRLRDASTPLVSFIDAVTT